MRRRVQKQQRAAQMLAAVAVGFVMLAMFAFMLVEMSAYRVNW